MSPKKVGASDQAMTAVKVFGRRVYLSKKQPKITLAGGYLSKGADRTESC